jgi:hypothetical protein
MANEKDKFSLVVVPPILKDKPPGANDPIYLLPYEVYTDPKLVLPEQSAGILRQMIKYGSAFGFIPNANIGIGSMCFLANLRSLKTE